jgi:hypothetical protein
MSQSRARRRRSLNATSDSLSQYPFGFFSVGWTRSALGGVCRPRRLMRRVTAEVPLRCIPRTKTPAFNGPRLLKAFAIEQAA